VPLIAAPESLLVFLMSHILPMSGGSFHILSNQLTSRANWQVDYSGFMTINPQKFGQKYVGKVHSLH
jgi:hypothetical protein